MLTKEISKIRALGSQINNSANYKVNNIFEKEKIVHKFS